jgi:hypothetical protein
MEHLYAGYKNLIQRILETKETAVNSVNTPRNFSGLTADGKGVRLAQSASLRFERLSDRLQLLILSETREFLEEKDALISTVHPFRPSNPKYATDLVNSTSISMLRKTLRLLHV